MPKCSGKKGDGSPCGAYAMIGNRYCFTHEPTELGRSRAARARRRGGKVAGGHNRKVPRTVKPDEAPPPPKTTADAVAYASWALNAVVTGLIDVRVAREVAHLLKEFRHGLERPDLERSLEALEKKLGEVERKQERPW